MPGSRNRTEPPPLRRRRLTRLQNLTRSLLQTPHQILSLLQILSLILYLILRQNLTRSLRQILIRHLNQILNPLGLSVSRSE
jgi:hypothetical protein